MPSKIPVSRNAPLSRNVFAATVAGVLAAGLISSAVWGRSQPQETGQAAPEASVASSSFAVSPDPATDATPPPQPGKDLLWQITSLTTVAGQTPTTTTASLCLKPEELASPPVEVTGPQCGEPAFTAQDHTVSWSNDCDAVKGGGSLNYAADGQSFAGDITVVTAAEDVTLHVSGVITGTCDKVV